MKLKKGDNVIVIAGKDKGKKGKVVRVFKENNKVVVEGVNVHKKHQRPRKSNEKGQILEIPAALSASNVMLVEDGKGVRSGYKAVGDKKIRISKKSGSEI